MWDSHATEQKGAFFLVKNPFFQGKMNVGCIYRQQRKGHNRPMNDSLIGLFRVEQRSSKFKPLKVKFRKQIVQVILKRML